MCVSINIYIYKEREGGRKRKRERASLVASLIAQMGKEFVYNAIDLGSIPGSG